MLVRMGLFYFIAILAFDVPNTIEELGGPPVPYQMLLFFPFVGLIIVANLWARSGIGEFHLRWDISDVTFLGFITTMAVLELAQAGFRATEIACFTQVWDCLIYQYVVLYALYYCLQSFHGILDVPRMIFIAASQVIFVLSSVQLAVYAGVVDTGLEPVELFHERPRLFNVNVVSYVGVCAACLWLFFRPTNFPLAKQGVYLVMLAPSIVLISANQTRGAFLLLLLIVALKLATLRHFAVRTLVIVTVLVGAVITLDGGRPLVREILAVVSFGRGLTNEMEMEARGIESDSEKVTTVSARTAMFVLAAERFVEDPVFGIGEAETSEVRILIPDYPRNRWMGLHTHYLIILVAYGAVGAVAGLFFAFSLCRLQVGRITESVALAMLLFGTMTFIADLLPWYALIGYLGRFPQSLGTGRDSRSLV